jgi:hypothetical protein
VRGALFAAAGHALALETWFTHPDARQRAAIQRASAHLERAEGSTSPFGRRRVCGACLAGREE